MHDKEPMNFGMSQSQSLTIGVLSFTGSLAAYHGTKILRFRTRNELICSWGVFLYFSHLCQTTLRVIV